MKRHISFIFFFFLYLTAINAQEKHFIFIQSETNQPFYVQLNNNVFSSTGNGYLNIAQLTQGKYYLIIGFAKNSYPEQKFVVAINDGEAGAGFTLKQQADKAWVLVNYITGALITTDIIEIKTIIQPPVVAEVAAPQLIVENKIVAPVITHPAVSLSVRKTYDRKSAQGIDQVYVDKTDTVAIFIPTTDNAVKTTANKPITIGLPAATTNTVGKCSSIANKEDFYKLRLEMAAATTDAVMIDAGKKAFAKKCFTVEQLKNLGVLFLSEQSRYNFFEVAKTHVSDAENFKNLSSQFTLPDITEKFSALSKSN